MTIWCGSELDREVRDTKVLGDSSGWREQAVVRKVIRRVVAAVVIIVVTAVAGLELWYRALLPSSAPVASKQAVPDLVKRSLWAYDFRGDGEPELRRMFPFFVSIFIRGREAPQNLAAGVARFYGKPERQLHYMLHQAALATWISRNWSAEDAINTDASHLWMGSDSVGAESGASLLFGKGVGELTIPEIALLVATARSPKAFSPLCHPERALDARRDVLERMLAVRLINETQLAAADAAPLGVRGICERSDEPRAQQ